MGSEMCIRDRKDACVPDGQPCAKNSECVSGSCVSGTCQNACNIYQGDATCPAGMGCKRLNSSTIEGSCQPLGSKPVDSQCTKDVDCDTLFCLNGFCQQPCNEFAPNTCPVGQICRPAGAYGVCSPYIEPEVPDAGPGPDSANADTTTTNPGPDSPAGPGEPDVTSESIGSGNGTPTPTTTPAPEEEKGILGCSGSEQTGSWPWVLGLTCWFMFARRRGARRPA